MIEELNFKLRYSTSDEFMEYFISLLRPRMDVIKYKYPNFNFTRLTDRQFLYLLKLLKIRYETTFAHPTFEDYYDYNSPFSIENFKNLDGQFIHGLLHSSKATTLFHKMTKVVKGQDHAVKDIISAWELHSLTLNQPRVDKTTVLIQGGTGCGKTFILKQLAKQARVPFVHFDASTLTADGYVGASVEDIMYQLSTKITEGPSRAIVLLDEIDKICTSDSKNDIGTFGAQKALLTLLEAESFNFNVNNKKSPPPFSNMKAVMFMLAGSFSQFTESKVLKKNPFGFENKTEEESSDFTQESLIKAGLIPELAGRIGHLITLNPMTEEIFDDIIENKDAGLRLKYKTLMAEIGGEFKLSNKKQVIKEALKLNLGARGLNTLVQKEFTKQFNKKLFS